MALNSEGKKYEGYIYIVTNSINDRIYIGQTRRTIEQRWYDHLYQAAHPETSSRSILHDAMRKYGADSFSVHQLDKISCETKQELIDGLNLLERKRIDEYNALVTQNGYNISKGGTDCSFVGRKVSKYDLNLNYIETYDSCQEAGRQNNLDGGTINQCCVHYIHTAGGYLWAFEGEQPVLPEYLSGVDLSDLSSDDLGSKEMLKESVRRKVIQKWGREDERIFQYDSFGNLINVFQDIIIAAKELGTTNYEINKNVTGVQLHYGKTVLRYEKDSFDKFPRSSFLQPVSAYDSYGILVKNFETVSDAAEYCGVHTDAIHQAIKRKCFCAGYLFSKYGEPIERKSRMNHTPVDMCDLDGNVIKHFESLKDVSPYFGVKDASSNVIHALENKSLYKGYLWNATDPFRIKKLKERRAKLLTSKKILSLDDLYNFYSQKRKSMTFNSDKNGYNIAVQTKATFNIDKESDPSEGLMFGKIRAFHDFGNLNKSYIDKDVLEKNLCSMENRPIMADIVDVRDKNGNYVKDFNGHTIQYDEENDKIIYIEHPVGHFINPDSFHLEYDEEYERDFAVADVVIYEEYTDTCDILRRRQEVDCSVELVIRDMAYNAKTKELHINDFYVQGCTLLGEKLTPGMSGSKLSLKDFSESNNSVFSSISDEGKHELISTLERLNETLSSLHIENCRKEDESTGMKKFDENTEVTEPEDVEETEAEEVESIEVESQDAPKLADADEQNLNDSNSTEENTDEKTVDTQEEVTEDVTEDSFDENSGTYTRIYELSHDDIRCSLYNLLIPYEELDADLYYISEVYDDHFIYESWCSERIYDQKYAKDGDLVSFEGERVEMFRELLTASEKAELETMRSNYSTMQTELNTYKNKELASQREEILADEAYSEYLNTEEFTKIRENINTYSLEDLRTECELAYAKAVRSNKKLSFTTEEPKKTTPSFFGFAHADRESSFFDGLLKSAK